jgi:plasmid stabilization system protein ParE
MSTMAISFAGAALRDLEAEQTQYVGQRVPDVGIKIVEDIFQCLQSFADHRVSGRTVPEFERSDLRELVRPPFRIVYWCDPLRVRIVRVWKREEDTDSANDIR